MKKIYLIPILFGILLFSGCSQEIEGRFDVSQKTDMYQPFFHFADTNGNQTGTTNAIGDYSATPTKFYIAPNTNEQYEIERLLIHIEDSGTFDTGAYGNGLSLTNGITVYLKIKGITYNLTNSHPVKTNGDWGTTLFDIDHQQFGTGNEFINARWTFSKAGQPIYLNGANGDEIGIELNDNFIGLVEHRFQFQGKVLTNKLYEVN